MRIRICPDNHKKRIDVDLDRQQGVKSHAPHIDSIMHHTKRSTSTEANGLSQHIPDSRQVLGNAARLVEYITDYGQPNRPLETPESLSADRRQEPQNATRWFQ